MALRRGCFTVAYGFSLSSRSIGPHKSSTRRPGCVASMLYHSIYLDLVTLVPCVGCRDDLACKMSRIATGRLIECTKNGRTLQCFNRDVYGSTDHCTLRWGWWGCGVVDHGRQRGSSSIEVRYESPHPRARGTFIIISRMSVWGSILQ